MYSSCRIKEVLQIQKKASLFYVCFLLAMVFYLLHGNIQCDCFVLNLIILCKKNKVIFVHNIFLYLDNHIKVCSAHIRLMFGLILCGISRTPAWLTASRHQSRHIAVKPYDAISGMHSNLWLIIEAL